MVNKKLGYTTNIGNGESALKKKISPINASYGENLLGGINNQPLISPAKIEMPVDLKYQQNFGNAQSGTSKGGVTDEGVITRDPNLVNLPQIKDDANTSYGANLPNIASPQVKPTSATANNGETETTPPQTPETGTTGSTGTESGETIDSYEDFLMKQGGYYKEMYEKMLEQIEQNKQNAVQQAEQERQRGVIDARSSQELNKATYGENAEKLAGIGLAGSGYSDYLNQQAYATQRAETQGANAQAEATKLVAQQQASSDKMNADLSYTQNMATNEEKLAQYQQKKEEQAKAEAEQKKQYYAMLLNSANSGEYTSEQLSSLAAQYGLDDTQIAELQGAADKYKTNKQSLSYTEAMQMISDYGVDLDVSYLETLLSTDSISQKQYDDLIAQYNKAITESGDINSANTDKIDDLHEQGKIDEETYTKQKEQWNSNIDTTDGFFNSGNMSASEAKKLFNDTIGNGWCSPETKKALQATYDRLYKVTTNDVKFNNDGGWWIFGSTDMAEKGNNFSLIDDSGFKYRIQSGGKVTDPTIKSLASNTPDGIFGLRGQIYYKKGGEIYLVEKRDNSYGDHYDKLFKKFFG